MKLDVSKINEILSKVDFTPYEKPDAASERKVVAINIPENYAYDGGVQGESNHYQDIYPITDYYALIAEVETDSYGEDYRVTGISIKKAVEKTVKVYEYE